MCNELQETKRKSKLKSFAAITCRSSARGCVSTKHLFMWVPFQISASFRNMRKATCTQCLDLASFVRSDFGCGRWQFDEFTWKIGRPLSELPFGLHVKFIGVLERDRGNCIRERFIQTTKKNSQLMMYLFEYYRINYLELPSCKENLSGEIIDNDGIRKSRFEWKVVIRWFNSRPMFGFDLRERRLS